MILLFKLRQMKMIKHGKQEKVTEHIHTSKLDEAYSKQDALLNGGLLTALEYDQQLQFCRLNREITHYGWRYFEKAMQENDFETAVDYFIHLLRVGFNKALDVLKTGLDDTAFSSQESKFTEKTAEAYYKRGLQCHVGIGVKRDSEEAFRYYRLATERGHADAQYCLGILCGQTIDRNKQEAADLLKLSAKQGHAAAQSLLSVMYTAGLGIEKNEEKATHWREQSAERGYPSAQDDLGLILLSQGGEQNDQRAFRYFRLAAKQGLASAQYHIGAMYENGRGVKKNIPLALRWYKLAAERGCGDAQTHLGKKYEKGLDVELNNKEAAHWYRLALKQEHIEGGYQLKQMFKKLLPKLKEYVSDGGVWGDNPPAYCHQIAQYLSAALDDNKPLDANQAFEVFKELCLGANERLKASKKGRFFSIQSQEEKILATLLKDKNIGGLLDYIDEKLPEAQNTAHIQARAL